MARGIGRFTVRLAVASMLAACARQEYHADTPASYLTADGCVQSNQDLLEATGLYAGRFLTVGTGDPAVSPWWEGGTTREHPEWTMNDPYLGRGYEGALTFEVAQRMGFSAHQVRFVSVGSDGLVAPGPKDFAMTFEEGSPFVECVNLALDEIESDGTLDELRREWLPTDVAAPLLGR